jgi:AbiV family abortive infection protein
MLRTLSEAAFENAAELLEESELLMEHQKLARSYALAVLSMEELSKSLMWNVYFLLSHKHAVKDPALIEREVKLFTRHREKQSVFIFLLIFPKIVEESIKEKSETGHLSKENLNRVASRLDPILNNIQNLETNKQDAFYVGVRQEGKINIPGNNVTRRRKCLELISLIREHLNQFETIIHLDLSSPLGQQLQATCEDMLQNGIIKRNELVRLL